VESEQSAQARIVPADTVAVVRNREEQMRLWAAGELKAIVNAMQFVPILVVDGR
jgi:hypothetical protein